MRAFTVLMLCNSGDNTEERAKAIVDTSSKGQYKAISPYLPLTELFKPDGEIRHAVVSLSGSLIINITQEQVHVEPRKIIDDYNKRQIPRFR